MSQTIAACIRAQRELRGLTQIELARRMGFKNHSSIGHWENGRTPDAESVKKLADAFGDGCTPRDIDPLGEAFTVAKRKPRGAAKAKSPVVPASAVGTTASALNGSSGGSKSHGVDNSVEVGKIRYSLPTRLAEGPMKDLIDQVVGAVLQIPRKHRQAFADRMSAAALDTIHELRKPGSPPGKGRKTSSAG